MFQVAFGAGAGGGHIYVCIYAVRSNDDHDASVPIRANISLNQVHQHISLFSISVYYTKDMHTHYVFDIKEGSTFFFCKSVEFYHFIPLARTSYVYMILRFIPNLKKLLF